jgi:hypothetical protein
MTTFAAIAILASEKMVGETCAHAFLVIHDLLYLPP